MMTESQLLRVSRGVPQHVVPVDREWPRGTFSPLASNIPPTATSKHTPPCDVTAGKGICAFGGKKVIVADAVSKGTVGLYSFSETSAGYATDISGNGNHALVMKVVPNPPSPSPASPTFAPGEFAIGNSGVARFDPSSPISTGPDRFGGSGSFLLTESSFLQLKTSASITSLTKDFSVSFWMFFAESSVQAAMGGCPLFSLGDNMLSLLPGHQLTVAFANQPIITSRGYVRTGQWNHVAFTYSSSPRSTFALYINGVRDMHLPTTMEAPLKPTVLIGSHPRSQCTHIRLYIDDLRLSSAPADHPPTIPSPLLPASAFPALGTVEPTFTQLGCSRTQPCDWESAKRACNSGYHLCSEAELRAGAYNAARTLGWMTWDDHIWTSDGDGKDILNYDPNHPDNKNKTGPAKDKKVALCCAFD